MERYRDGGYRYIADVELKTEGQHDKRIRHETHALDVSPSLDSISYK